MKSLIEDTLLLRKLNFLLLLAGFAECAFGQAATAPVLQKNVATASDLTDGVLGTGRIAKESALASIGTQGYQPNQPLGGCGVDYVSALDFVVGACTYTISGVTYTSAITTVTLSAADPTDPRIDVIAVDTTGVVVVLAGTPAASPAAADVDPATQLQLTFVYVAAAAVVPSNITTDNIYDENVEWACTSTATINCNSSSNPYRNTKDIEATASGLARSFTLIKPAAGTIDLATRNTLVFYIRSKAAWPTGTSGSTAARFLSIFWQNGATQRGVQVVVRDGTFGFSSSNTSAYQQISIPTSLFGNAGLPVTTLRGVVSGPAGTSTIGFYIDAISLLAGVTPPSLPTTLMNFKGTWSAATSYVPNDTVVFAGVGYVALLANTNTVVTTTSTWATVASINAGRIFYPENSVTSDVAGDTALAAFYKTASATPSSGAESDVVITSPTTGAYVLGQAFATVPSQPNVTSLPAGTAYRYIYAKTDAGTASIQTDLIRYKTTGNEATTGVLTIVSFALNGASADTIHRTSGSFISDGFTNGTLVTVSGSASNNKSFTVQTVTALDLTLILADVIVTEAAGASITIVSKEKLLRSGASSAFGDTVLTLQVFTYSDATAYAFAPDDRIIFKWWAAKQSGSGTRTITISTESATVQSYIQTTIGSAGGSGSSITALTGDVTAAGPGSVAATLANIPTGTPMAGSLLATAIGAPGTPAAGKGSIYVDSTSKNVAVIDDAGVVKHGVQTKAAVTNNFATAISDAGVVSVAQPALSNLSDYATARIRSFGITVDGGGSAITTGVKGDLQAPFTCTITSWTILLDQSGSIQFDIWELAFSTSVSPTVANTITAAAKPLVSSTVNATSTSVGTWANSQVVTAGDMIRFNVDSATTATRATLKVQCLI